MKCLKNQFKTFTKSIDHEENKILGLEDQVISKFSQGQ